MRRWCFAWIAAGIFLFPAPAFSAVAPEFPLPDNLGENFLGKLKSVPVVAGAKPLPVEQVRAKYETDRLFDIATNAWKANDFPRARQALDAAREKLTAAGLLNDEHRYLFTLGDGLSLLQSKQFDAARQAMEPLVELAEKAFGAKSESVAMTHSLLAFCHVATKQFPAAIEHAEKAAAIFREVKHDEFDTHALIVKCLVALKRWEKKLDESAEYQRELCEVYIKGNRADSAEYADEQLKAAAYDGWSGNWAAARPRLDEAVAILEKTLGKEDARTKVAADSLKNVLAHLDVTERQSQSGREALDLRRQIDALDEEKDAAELMRLRERLLVVTRTIPYLNEEELFQVLWEVGTARLEAKQYSGARELFSEIEALMGKTKYEGPKYRGALQFRLAECDGRLGREDSARERFNDALKLTPPNDAEFVELRKIAHARLVTLDANAEDLDGVIEHGCAAIAIMRTMSPVPLDEIDGVRLNVAIKCSTSKDQRELALREMNAAKTSLLGRYDVADPRIVSALCHEVIVFYHCGDAKCVELARALYDPLSQGDGIEKGDKWDSGLAFAICLRAFGGVEESRRLLQEIVDKAKFDAEPARNLRSSALFVLAGIEARAGNREAAERSYLETIAICTALHGSEDAQTIRRQSEWKAYQSGKLPSFDYADTPFHVRLSDD